MPLVGGMGEPKPANDEIQQICNNLKGDLENKSGKTFVEFTVVTYCSQVVAGTNYFVKFFMGCGSDKSVNTEKAAGMSGSRTNKAVLELLKRPGNDKCADCGSTSAPEYASWSCGVFVCESCAGIHRSLGSMYSKVKSLKLDVWNEEQIQFMANNGNNVAKLKYEKNVPACYRRPTPSDPQILREQWICAKYERQEFTGSGKPPYLSAHREGMLWKRGKDDKHFQQRRFVLDTADNSLKYFTDKGGDNPKATLRLDDMNITVCPHKVGNPNGMQITYESDGRLRSIFVYADTAQDAVEWYTAIRSARLNRLAIAFPGSAVEELCRVITRDFTKEGWLMKTGPRAGDAFRKRWVTVDKKKLLYYEDQMDAYPKGEIYLGTKGIEAFQGFAGSRDSGFGFILKTPDRSYQFSAETEDEQRDWVFALQQVISDSSR